MKHMNTILRAMPNVTDKLPPLNYAFAMDMVENTSELCKRTKLQNCIEFTMRNYKPMKQATHDRSPDRCTQTFSGFKIMRGAMQNIGFWKTCNYAVTICKTVEN